MQEVGPGDDEFGEREVNRLVEGRAGWRSSALDGNARPIGALAADQLTLDDRHSEGPCRERAGDVIARGAASPDDHVAFRCLRARCSSWLS